MSWTCVKDIFKKRRTTLVLLFILFFSSFFYQPKDLPDSYIGKDVAAILKAMPKKDRKKLEYFFLECVAWDGFGYVLLGEKPMALTVITETIHPFQSFSAFKEFIIPRRIKSVRSYKTWKKYEKFFPVSDFAFFYEKFRNDPLITLVNKKAFIKKVEEHKEDFIFILHRNIQGGELLQEGLHKPLLSEVLLNHDGLIGTLLGYGKNNAFLFHQRNQLNTKQEIQEFCKKHHFESAWTDEEFEAFRKQFASHSWITTYITGAHLKDLRLMALPGFVAVFNDSETQYWRTHYLKTKEKIINFYKNKDFLETTLRILTSQTPI